MTQHILDRKRDDSAQRTRVFLHLDRSAPGSHPALRMLHKRSRSEPRPFLVPGHQARRRIAQRMT